MFSVAAEEAPKIKQLSSKIMQSDWKALLAKTFVDTLVSVLAMQFMFNRVDLGPRATIYNRETSASFALICTLMLVDNVLAAIWTLMEETNCHPSSCCFRRGA